MADQTLRLLVVTDETTGQVLATQQVDTAPDAAYHRLLPDTARPASDEPAIQVFRRITAGEGQVQHEVDVEVPDDVFRRMDVAALHDVVQRRVDSLRAQ